jgi:hypothetical protein
MPALGGNEELGVFLSSSITFTFLEFRTTFILRYSSSRRLAFRLFGLLLGSLHTDKNIHCKVTSEISLRRWCRLPFASSVLTQEILILQLLVNTSSESRDHFLHVRHGHIPSKPKFSFLLTALSDLF